MFSSSEVFLPSSLRMCSIEVEGVSGSLPVHAIGTARFLVQCSDLSWILCYVHNALLTNGRHNLLSLSQLLGTTTHSVSFESPASISLTARDVSPLHLVCPLHEEDGLYSLRCVMISSNDPSLAFFSQVDFTGPDSYTPSSSSSLWSCRVLMAPIEPCFRTSLRSFADSFVAPAVIPPSRRTYLVSSIADMVSLAMRFMGVGYDRLAETIDISLGLSPHPGRVPPLLFPPGKVKRKKTPVVTKNKVKFLHRASVCEVVFTAIFQTDDVAFRYGSAFVD